MSKNRQRLMQTLAVTLAASLLVGGMPSMTLSVSAAVDFGWEEENGNWYWYEGGVRQGYDPDNAAYRGKEIYDPGSDAWYWLDNVDRGKKAVSKDVYQESLAGNWAGESDGTGKWVRYDAQGHMIKGWDTNEDGTYYFDPVYGTMAKGYAVIDGNLHYFDKATGVESPAGWEGLNGWVVVENMDGNWYWYENGVRQGYDPDNAAYRGKEIYDPDSNAWYWLDNVDQGKKAVSKDVYQESAAGDWAAGADGTGKWVRYDAQGHMVKGWSTNENGTYYFDPIYGTMAKGVVTIDGKRYEFNQGSGTLEKELPDTDTGIGDGGNTDDSSDAETKNDLSKCTVTLSENSYTYDGTEKKPAVTVKSGSIAIDAGEYTVDYSNNVNAGTATVTVTAKSESKAVSGSTSATFTIGKGQQKLTAQPGASKLNEGETTSITVNGAHGKISYQSTNTGVATVSSEGVITAVAAGTADITVTAAGDSNYESGTVALTVTVEKKASIIWEVSDDGRLTVTGECGSDGLLWYGQDGNLSPYDNNDRYPSPWCTGYYITSAYINVKGVKNLSYLFENCGSLVSVDLSDLDTSNVTDMSHMFYGCYGLRSLNISNFNTSKVTDMSNMFYGCYGLRSLNISNFNTSKVTDMSNMFYGCSGLTSLDLSNFDTSNVTDMSGMFGWRGFNDSDYTNEASSLTSLDLSSFNTSKVTDMSSMFRKCNSLTSLDLSSFDTSSVTDMSNMFYSCDSLTSLDLSNFDTSKVRNMNNMFSSIGISSLTDLDLSSFDTSSVTDMSSMFTGCRSLRSLDISNFNTSRVTNMSNMFSGCSSLTSLDLSNFDTSNVANMSCMFGDDYGCGCSNLTSLDISSFDTSNVMNMSHMFNGCSSLTNLDLSSFDTSNATDMDYMFCNCSSLTKIIVGSGWTTEQAYPKDMFENCSVSDVTHKN